MKNQIRILMIEDVAADFTLVRLALRNGGLSFQCQRVETESEFLRELEESTPDIILSDHGLPSFDGFKALTIARARCPDVPFIFVTGALGEAVAVDSLKRGANDYVLKTELPNLVPSIQRALNDAQESASRRQADTEHSRLLQELKELLARIKTVSGLLPVCTFCKRIRKHPNEWLELEVFLQENSEATITHEFCPDCSQRFRLEILRRT